MRRNILLVRILIIIITFQRIIVYFRHNFSSEKASVIAGGIERWLGFGKSGLENAAQLAMTTFAHRSTYYLFYARLVPHLFLTDVGEQPTMTQRPCEQFYANPCGSNPDPNLDPGNLYSTPYRQGDLEFFYKSEFSYSKRATFYHAQKRMAACHVI